MNTKELFKKLFSKEVIFYIIFGVLTTLVNLVSFYMMNSIFKWNENLSNFLAISLSILFAYFTNKTIVFHADTKTFKERFSVFTKFILGRLFTMLIEFLGGVLLFKLPIPNIIIKLGLNVIVIILNFFISKFFAFKKKK